MSNNVNFNLFNEKYFINKIEHLDYDQKEIINKQILLFYHNKNAVNCNNYNIGEKVKLKANTLIHGIREQKSLIAKLQSIKNYGLISNTFFTENKDWKINYCVSTWHIKKSIELCDYVKLYSGMTVRTALKENLLIPYGEFDSYVQSIKDKEFQYIFAELSMENTFLPSLATNLSDKQLALIFYSKDNDFKNIINNNLFSKQIPDDTIKKFFCLKDYERVLNNRKFNEYDRIAYIPFGIPSTYIEGILVGRKIENNKKILYSIKSIFPNCYICNLDGIVIS